MPAKKMSDMRSPQQQRSQETLRKLLDATEAILSEGSPESFSLRQVLKRSGVSNGAFYARFDNKEALIKACWMSLVESVDENIDANFADLLDRPLAEKVDALLRWQVERYYRYRGVFTAYLNLLRTTQLKPTRVNLRRYAELGRKTTDFLMASVDEIQHPEPERAIDIAVYVTYAAARELIFFPKGPHASSMKMSKDELVKQLSHVFLATLCYPPK